MFGYINLALLGHFYRSVRIKWAVMYLCVRDINVSSFYDFDIWFLDSADSVFFIFILFRYDVLLINISNWANCISLIYHKNNWDKKDSASASFLEIYLIVDNNVQISTRLRDKGDDFNFGNIHFQQIYSNIPVNLSYGVYILQIIWYSRACTSYSDFLQRHLILSTKLQRHV